MMKAKDYFSSLNKFGIKPGLERIKLLLDYLGNPQEDLKVIHVAGTNGKGSTSAILTSIYQSGGYRVGSYNSPHIIEFNERIRIDQVNISDEELDRLITEMREAIEAVAQELEHPSFFEIVTALAFLYFSQQQVDLVILEVGLGGRFDATNVVDSLISVITNVSLDHTDYLGDNLEDIAWEKAGIIKEEQVVVTASKNKVVLDKLLEVCQQQNSKLLNINYNFRWRFLESKLDYQRIDIKSNKREYSNIRIPLLGEHQIFNTATALAVVEALKGNYPLSSLDIRKGIANSRWPGRVELINKDPLIILDGAHNVAGAKSLIKALDKLKYNRLFLVISLLADKDVDGVIEEVIPRVDKVIITKNNNSRAIDTKELKVKVSRYKKEVIIRKQLNQAIKYSLSQATREDLILVSGSLYTVAEARQILISK